jgi:hypothetical protein
MFGSIFTKFRLHALTADMFLSFGISKGQYLSAALGCVLMLLVSIWSAKGSVREQIARLPYAVRYAAFAGLFCAVILFGSYGYGFDEAQFIYNQF